MEAYIYDCAGEKWALPVLLSWDISHGFGEACDSFEIEFLYRSDMADTLAKAVEMEAVHGGRTVFYGRVDEYEAVADSRGATVKLRGRGMQALMLDNEAESADYYYCDLDFILSRHVRVLGIEKIAASEGGKAERFSVENGWSHWKAFSSFAEFCCGFRPRFAPDGTLVPDGEAGGGTYKVDGKTAVMSQSHRVDRYGVISHAVVKRRYSGVENVAENADFIALGGKCRRIVNVPKSTGFDAMRHEGEYQIKKSMENFRCGRICVAECFPAFPGDKVEMSASPLGVKGHFMVTATRCVGSGSGAYTEIDMREI